MRINKLVLLLLLICGSAIADDQISKKQGDVNNDGKVNVKDIVELVNILLGQTSTFNSDVNSDGITNAEDVLYISNIIMTSERNMYNNLIIFLNNGKEKSYSFEERPKITFRESYLIISTESNEDVYSMSNITKMAFY